MAQIDPQGDYAEVDPFAVLVQVQERVMLPRLGTSMLREMDRDIAALRDAALALSKLIDQFTWEYTRAIPYSERGRLIQTDEFDPRFSPPAVPATHRRRALKEQGWEPIPEGESYPAQSITYTMDGQP